VEPDGGFWYEEPDAACGQASFLAQHALLSIRSESEGAAFLSLL
jgi:hypothetical protein